MEIECKSEVSAFLQEFKGAVTLSANIFYWSNRNWSKTGNINKTRIEIPTMIWRNILIFYSTKLLNDYGIRSLCVTYHHNKIMPRYIWKFLKMSQTPFLLLMITGVRAKLVSWYVLFDKETNEKRPILNNA